MDAERLLAGPGTRAVELAVDGMTCASCVQRVERRLGKLDGVQATVNLPLESALVTAPSGVTDQQLIDTVTAAGYRARIKEARRPLASPTGGGTVRGGGSINGGDAVPSDGRQGGRDARDQDEGYPDGAPAAGNLRPRLMVAAVLTVPLLMISMVPAARFPHWGWAALLLATPVVTWAAWPFHRAAAVNARHLASTMDTLVSLGVTAAYLFSVWQLAARPGLTAGPHTGMSGMDSVPSLYFETAAVVVTFLLLGRYLEARAKARAGDALKALLSLGAAEAAVVRQGIEHRIPAAELVPGDEFVVRPGERIATDGYVVAGSSAVDTSVITGESVPVEVGPDDTVIGATMNTSGRLLVRATRVGSETTLAQMARLVSLAQTGKAPIARLADRISAVFVPVVLVLALLTLVLWLGVAGTSPAAVGSAFSAAMAVLIIACPCALGLATPVGLLAGTGRGAQLGILIKGPEVLEDTRRVDTVLLDKTGTVTTGRLEVARVLPLAELAADRVLALAGAVEAGSEHPVARAVTAAAGGLPAGLAGAGAGGFTSAPGGGVRAVIDGAVVLAGREGWLRENGVAVPEEQRAVLRAEQESGCTAIWLAVDGRPVGIISLRDRVKDGSAAAVRALRELGLRPVLLTGDNAAVAHQVAAAVGIPGRDVIADVPPAGKAAVVRRLQAAGSIVAMVGDGVNDAPALAQADLGIAMGSGTDVAMEAADLTLMGSSLNQVAQAIRLSRRTLGIIRSNLFWAFSYNAVGIPVAALGLLNPMLAGAAMAASSVLVVTNSLRLRRFDR